MSDFGRRLIIDQAFDHTLRAAIDALRSAGFVVTAMDVRRLIRDELKEDCRRYVLLTATSTQMLARAIKLDLDAGVAVPCQVAIYELADGRTAVGASEPMSDLSYSVSWQRESPALAEVAAALDEQVGRPCHACPPAVGARRHEPSSSLEQALLSRDSKRRRRSAAIRDGRAIRSTRAAAQLTLTRSCRSDVCVPRHAGGDAPTWRLMPAGRAVQRETTWLEVQNVIVAAQRAEHPSQTAHDDVDGERSLTNGADVADARFESRETLSHRHSEPPFFILVFKHRANLGSR